MSKTFFFQYKLLLWFQRQPFIWYSALSIKLLMIDFGFIHAFCNNKNFWTIQTKAINYLFLTQTETGLIFTKGYFCTDLKKLKKDKIVKKDKIKLSTEGKD